MSLIRKEKIAEKPLSVPEQQSEEGVSEESVCVASQWQRMWWRFRKQRLAILGTWAGDILYGPARLCEFRSA